MGASHDQFFKYPRTPHLFGSRGTDDDKHLNAADSTRLLADESLIVEEKLDGTNAGLHFSTAGAMVLQCRGHLITEGMHPQYDLFKQWASVKRAVLEARLEDRYLLYGEWLYARHSVHYLALPHYFFEFDLFDKQRQEFLDLERRQTLLDGTGIVTVPVVHRGRLDRQSLSDLIRPSRYQAQFENPRSGCTDNLVEGLYLRVEAQGVVTGRAKFVRPEFVEKVQQSEHWQHREMVPNQLAPDSAKPLTIQVDAATGRISTPKHAVRGEHLARSILRELDCPLPTREAICGLVRYHGRPVFLLEREDPRHEAVRLSWLTSNRLLYWFALADSRGRDTESLNRPEENLHLGRMLAEEHGCFDRAYPFSHDHARFHYFRAWPQTSLEYASHEQYACTVTMLAGLPGSGKNTWLAKNVPQLPVVSLDELRRELEIDPTDDQGQVAQAAKEQCREHLRARRAFAFNATNTLPQTRQRWITLFASYQARIEIVYLEPPWERLLRQNRHRTTAVPEAVVCRLAAKCEPPSWLEGHTITWKDD